MRTSQKHCALFLAGLCAAVSGHAQGTAFIYRGRLHDNGTPATGTYDMRFAAYDANAAGQLVAGPLPVNVIGVTNGLFTTRIDFGAGVFTGPPRWLEISVSPAGAGSFQTLSPRQELTSSPYSIRAQSAGTASNVSNGAVVKSLNNLRDDVTLAAGANVTLTPNGNTLTINSSGTGAFSLNGNNAYYTAGTVGIGTTQPQGLLDVAGGGVADTSALFVGADPGAYGRGGIIHHQSATYGWQELAQNTGSPTDGTLTYHYVNRTAPGTKVTSDVLTLRGDGYVGIGTATPASKLDIAAQDALRITGFQPFITMSDSAGFGLIRKANRYLQVVDGDLAFLYRPECNTFPCNQATENHLTIRFNGLVGIGTSLPGAKLHLFDAANSVAQRIESGAGINGWSRTEYANANGQWNVGTSRGFNGDQFYVHRQGSPAIAFAVQPNGDAFLQGTMNCRVLTITGGADIAEPFQMSSNEIPKGAVVVIDEANPGHLKMSAEAYDKRVAGIVSGANGIKPGISLHQEGAIEGGENVALSGRVFVQADAANGAIKPGDLLTTSDTPGHAMKVTDHGKAQGAILGKAMTGLKGGKGMVLVLVTLQ